MKDRADTGPAEIARDVIHGVAEGRFAPGQRLTEADLMVRYGAARSTVREALGQLAASGIVRTAPHKGAHIRHLTRREAEDILRVAEVLLTLAARQAAEAVFLGADPGPFLVALRAYENATQDRPRARARYYRALTDLAGNAELSRLLPALQTPLIRAQLHKLGPDPSDARRSMANAISTGSAERAARFAREYLGRLSMSLTWVPDSDFAPDPGGPRAKFVD